MRNRICLLRAGARPRKVNFTLHDMETLLYLVFGNIKCQLMLQQLCDVCGYRPNSRLDLAQRLCSGGFANVSVFLLQRTYIFCCSDKF